MNAFKRAILEHCAARQTPWDQQTLALVLGITSSHLSTILNMKIYARYGLPVKLAIDLSIVLGETPEFWLQAHTAVALEIAHTPELEMELAAIRERAANWKPGMHCKPHPKAWHAGYKTGYEAGLAARVSL